MRYARVSVASYTHTKTRTQIKGYLVKVTIINRSIMYQQITCWVQSHLFFYSAIFSTRKM